MSAELLREAAALMRGRAEAATPGGPRWETQPDEMHGGAVILPADSDSAIAGAGADDAEHIASWHPTVALAVAVLLASTAEHIASHDCEAHCEPDGCDMSNDARAVARAYLGRPA